MTGSRKYTNSKFLFNNKRVKSLVIKGFDAQEARSILSRLVDILRLVFEMYYIKFKVQEIRDNIHAYTENKKGRLYSFARNLCARPASLERNYLTTTNELAS
ncbi:hypothetical protein F0919_15275 [Taibaiella lutea]|uniref:Uncharacterized protein n=1 Tax=Taibaiella lutea TaxID=2608001 RepID=A0A5M6CCH6_9BACT|nr:hypothetical protein [Taibaiella lutea]KAA5532160.1 hypothetical protein F0919_15275 [Taibaiella lutea]